MTKKYNKTINEPINKVQFISDDEARTINAEASLMTNPYVRWAKFVMTDDQPNGNRERTPLDEFDNLIQSGVHMPIKMAEGRIEEGHEDASPIGVITHLTKEFVDGINRIVGLAAFWLKERPSDVSYIKERIDNDEPVNVSWELGAREKILAEDGVYDWRGLTVQAVTVVDKPAYQGRTQIIAMASKKKATEWNEEYINKLPDSSFLHIERGGKQDSEGRTSSEFRFFPVKDDKGLYVESKLREVLEEVGKSNLPMPILKSVKKTVTTLLERIDAGASLEEISNGDDIASLRKSITEEDTVELEQLKQRVAELETKLAAAESSLKEKETALTETSASLQTVTGEKDAMASELEELRKFKGDIDAEVQKAEKLETIKTKFAQASIAKDETYFVENSEKLLGLDEASLDFLVQEMAAFSKTDAQASLGTGSRIPNLNGESTQPTVKEIVQALKERKSK